MVLASGQLPYDYDHGKGPFRVPNPYNSAYPIGPSGVLLEQAEFVITAERRKLLRTLTFGGSNFLEDFFVYTNPEVIAPSGPYEPKTNGSTLGNELNPGSLSIIDHIRDMRLFVNNHFSFLSQDTDYDSSEYRMAWLQAVYPHNPSGFVFGEDADTFNLVTGHWSHRTPSEIGVIDYASDEVLGSSGVLYDVDFGELMFNPLPHISAFGLDTMHSRKVNGQNDGFSVQMFPIWPAFQKTDGSLVPLTSREPDTIPQSSDYQIDHITSGMIRLDGYVLFGDTKIYIGKYDFSFDESSVGFATGPQGWRSMLFGGNVDSSRIFMVPVAQASGVYRIAAKNRFQDFPTTTAESGKMSYWPNITSYWPNCLTVDGQLVGSTTTQDNCGYHVFDDCLWMTDVTLAPTATPDTGFCSGLAIMSPWTQHRMWVRYADQTPVGSIPLAGFPTVDKNWSTGQGLERLGVNTIQRLHPNPQSDSSTNSGQFIFMQYNDMLDFSTSIPTTSDSVQAGFVDNFPFGTSSTISLNDFWIDDTTGEYWVSNAVFVGVDMWKFDSSLKYINKYIFNIPSGINNARGFFMNGNHFLFNGEFGNLGTTNIRGSGIYPVHIIAEGTEPYDESGNVPQIGQAAVYPWEGKFINAAPYIGHRQLGEILDIIYVNTSTTHVIPGVYALVRWLRPSTSLNDLFLLRIEEEASSWEIRAISRLESGYQTPNHGRRDILYMSY